MHPSELKGHMNCMSALLVSTLYTGELLSLITTLVISSCLISVQFFERNNVTSPHSASPMTVLVIISPNSKRHMYMESDLQLIYWEVGLYNFLRPTMQRLVVFFSFSYWEEPWFLSRSKEVNYR